MTEAYMSSGGKVSHARVQRIWIAARQSNNSARMYRSGIRRMNTAIGATKASHAAEMAVERSETVSLSRAPTTMKNISGVTDATSKWHKPRPKGRSLPKGGSTGGD